ncbi:hypothetical protein BJ742DRAFT_860233 [Cladochytrium replicatum]|nr:hypothetical protein BJ742DRAFT_860233 [Cladochytrium replicatum]
MSPSMIVFDLRHPTDWPCRPGFFKMPTIENIKHQAHMCYTDLTPGYFSLLYKDEYGESVKLTQEYEIRKIWDDAAAQKKLPCLFISKTVVPAQATNSASVSRTYSKRISWESNNQSAQPPPNSLGNSAGFSVMLSYKWDDKEKVLHVRKWLLDHGMSVWMDIDKMTGNVYAKMAVGVLSSKVVVPCLSIEYAKSENCRRELCYAADLRKPLAPTMTQIEKSLDYTRQQLGWAGLITAGMLFIDISSSQPGTVQWEAKMAELRNEIENHMREIESGTGLQIQIDDTIPDHAKKLKLLLNPIDFNRDIDQYKAAFVEGTRSWLAERIQQWLESDEQIMWLTGGAGVGKSIMAWMVANRVVSSAEVGAQFYCRYNNADKNSPHKLVTSVAYQLALKSEEYSAMIGESLLLNL